jgi:hypothetical protein
MAEAHVMRTTRLFQAAGANFNRGQRAFFFALGYSAGSPGRSNSWHRPRPWRW